MPSARIVTGEMDVQIGRAIKTARVANGMSQSKLAETLGLTFQQVQKYETGHNRISTSALIVMCRKLAISPMDVIGPLIGEPTETDGLVQQVASLKQQLSDLKATIRSAVK